MTHTISALSFSYLIDDGDSSSGGANRSLGDDSYFLSHLSRPVVQEVSVIPIPAAFWLFGTALIGLVGFGKRRKAA